MTKNPITREEILRGLDGFQDPELGRSIVRLDQVQDVQISDGLVKIVLGLTSFSAPLWPELREEVRNLLRTQLTPDVDWEVVIREFPRPKEIAIVVYDDIEQRLIIRKGYLQTLLGPVGQVLFEFGQALLFGFLGVNKRQGLA